MVQHFKSTSPNDTTLSLGIWLAPCIIILPRIVVHDIFIEPVLLVGRLFARFVILLGCVARDDLGGR